MKTLFFILLLSFFLGSQAHAGLPEDCKVDAAFANGVWTPEPYANDEAIVVSFTLESQWQKFDTGKVLVLYHRDDGLNNLSEVFLMKDGETEDVGKRRSLMDRFFSLLRINGKALAELGPAGLISGPVQTYIALNSFNPGILRRVTSQTADDARQISVELNSGHPLLIIAHSMGNLYTNAAVLSLNDNLLPGSIGVVGLGVPAAYVVGDNQTNNRLYAKGEKRAMVQAASASYVTNTDDLVIGLLRKSGSPDWRKPLRANATNKNAEPPGHSFIDIYWHYNKATGKKAVEQAGAQISRLFEECSNKSHPRIFVPSRQVAPREDRSLPAPVLPFPKAATDGDSQKLPDQVIQAIDASFHWKPTHDAAIAFAQASLNYWLSVAKEGWRYNQAGNELVGATQVCLRTLLRKAPKPDSTFEDSYLGIILAPLTAKPSLFEKFSNADAVASGHPVLLNLDMGAACRTAGVSMSG
ncbi:UNVERIFIED_ORG: hypothetical protein BDU10_2540 [Burkholderia sp. CF145]